MADLDLQSALRPPGSWGAPPGDVLESLFEYFLTREDGASLLRTASHVNSHWRRAALEAILADTGTSRPPWWKRPLPSPLPPPSKPAPAPAPSDAVMVDAKGAEATSGGLDSTKALLGKGPGVAAAGQAAEGQGPAASEELLSPDRGAGGGGIWGDGGWIKLELKRKRRRSKRAAPAAAAAAAPMQAEPRGSGDAGALPAFEIPAAAAGAPQGGALKQASPAAAAAKEAEQVLSPVAPGAVAACESDGSTEARRRGRRRKAGALAQGLEAEAVESGDGGGDRGDGAETQEPAKKKARMSGEGGSEGRQGEDQAARGGSGGGSGDGGGGSGGGEAAPAQPVRVPWLRDMMRIAIQRLTGRV